MILLTVGTQLPFDRFVEMVDRIAPSLSEPVFAQIGQGGYKPINMKSREFVGPIEFERLIEECSLVIAHAGIGTVVMAQKHRKPMVLFPRRCALDEHRNDHQLATVRALGGRAGINVALDEAELARLIAVHHPTPTQIDQLPARDQLRNAISGLIAQERSRVLAGNRE